MSSSSSSDGDSDCCPTPIEDLRLPTQSAGVGYQTPVEKDRFDDITKRYGKPNLSPDSDKDTGFKRGIPGVSNQ